jgi:cytochrome bd-type quinol oxidase subunit 2
MLKEKNKKTSKFGLFSLLCFLAVFIIIGSTDLIISNDNSVELWFVFGLLILSVVLAIIGLVGKKQNQKNNVFSIITLVMTVVIFVLGML